MAQKTSVVVTGGASGIGLGITRHLLAKPETHVTILDVNPATSVNTLGLLSTEFPAASISFEQCDVSSWESQAAVFKKVYTERGRIDVVFANAGISERGNLLPEEDVDEPSKPDLATLNVNFIGVIYSVRLSIFYMSKNAGSGSTSNGLIVCTASNAGLYPFPVAPMYGATKAGVVNLVRSLEQHLAPKKIRINALAPSVIETNIAASADLFKAMILTPMSTAINSVAQFIEDESLSGKIAELHGEHVTFAEPPDFVDEDTRKNLQSFWNLGHA
ncbi:hypothetical protein N7495_007784 [Penicillium taxi]|uniref:uncharacterized protein n=1 Tax=Penicillium taxi TaxID=168475 RepID=UPI00254578EB|nr:uncharacterized protein N7495_007784 [Penicillium taxi]KAJ5887743.1 hypothetical protein N7495_007784 [Penicillium taxi]